MEWFPNASRRFILLEYLHHQLSYGSGLCGSIAHKEPKKILMGHLWRMYNENEWMYNENEYHSGPRWGKILCGPDPIHGVLWRSGRTMPFGRSMHEGHSSKGPCKSYSLRGSDETRIFGVFNAMAIIATSFGNGIIPEIQATLAPPVKGKMFKGLCVCYAVITVTFFTVAIFGHWAFGNEADGLILSNFLDDNGNHLFPGGFL